IGQSAARLAIVAPRLAEGFAEWITSHGAIHLMQGYEPRLLEGAALVFAATEDADQDRRIHGAARRMGLLVNSVDRIELCDFFTAAIVNRAPVCVAIGTEGTSPVLAQSIRARIDHLLSPALGSL